MDSWQLGGAKDCRWIEQRKRTGTLVSDGRREHVSSPKCRAGRAAVLARLVWYRRSARNSPARDLVRDHLFVYACKTAIPERPQTASIRAEVILGDRARPGHDRSTSGPRKALQDPAHPRSTGYSPPPCRPKLLQVHLSITRLRRHSPSPTPPTDNEGCPDLQVCAPPRHWR